MSNFYATNYDLIHLYEVTDLARGGYMGRREGRGYDRVVSAFPTGVEGIYISVG
jgi:hypothetical protein